MRQLLVECSDPGLVVSLAEEFENVLRQIDFTRPRSLHGQLSDLAHELGPGFKQAWQGFRLEMPNDGGYPPAFGNRDAVGQFELRHTLLLPQHGPAPETREQYVHDLADSIRWASWDELGVFQSPVVLPAPMAAHRQQLVDEYTAAVLHARARYPTVGHLWIRDSLKRLEQALELDDFFFDECPICQQMKAEVEAAEAEGHDHGWQWHYDDGGYPLIARYDPEGWDARWAEEEAAFGAWKAGEEHERQSAAAPAYEPPPVEPIQVDAETFLEIMRRPWLDPTLHRAAQKLTERCDVPVSGDRFGPGYRRLTRNEALSLVAGLHRQGVEVEALLAQIEAWPYQNVALDWLSEPEHNAALVCQAMETEIAPADDDKRSRGSKPIRPPGYSEQDRLSEAELARFRHHRDFIFTLARLVPPHARLWLRGWLEAVGHGAFTAHKGLADG